MAIEIIRVPDLGGAEEVEVIEIPIAVGDTIEFEQTLVVLESEKAAMELPAPYAGKVVKILVKEGDKFKKAGAPILELEIVAGAARTVSTASDQKAAQSAQAEKVERADLSKRTDKTSAPSAPEMTAATVPPPASSPASVATPTLAPAASDALEPESAVAADIYAGPAVRHLARELGVDLSEVKGSGPRSRLLKEDVQAFVKQAMAAPARSGAAIPSVPPIDFSQFGAIETLAMTKV
ncbi:MAG: E3 binding domain-containing protein, partial [Porticoccaceae bacterium]